MGYVIYARENGTMKNRLCNWTVIFEYEDGTKLEMYRVLDHRDQEYIDNEISSVIDNAGMWDNE